MCEAAQAATHCVSTRKQKNVHVAAVAAWAASAREGKLAIGGQTAEHAERWQAGGHLLSGSSSAPWSMRPKSGCLCPDCWPAGRRLLGRRHRRNTVPAGRVLPGAQWARHQRPATLRYGGQVGRRKRLLSSDSDQALPHINSMTCSPASLPAAMRSAHARARRCRRARYKAAPPTARPAGRRSAAQSFRTPAPGTAARGDRPCRPSLGCKRLARCRDTQCPTDSVSRPVAASKLGEQLRQGERHPGQARVQGRDRLRAAQGTSGRRLLGSRDALLQFCSVGRAWSRLQVQPCRER